LEKITVQVLQLEVLLPRMPLEMM